MAHIHHAREFESVDHHIKLLERWLMLLVRGRMAVLSLQIYEYDLREEDATYEIGGLRHDWPIIVLRKEKLLILNIAELERRFEESLVWMR